MKKLALVLCCAPYLAALAAAEQKPVATVDGTPIREDELNVRGQLIQLEQQAYQLRLRAVEEAVSRRLLEKAAAAKKLTPEQLLKQEVDDLIADPAPQEVEAFYLGQRDRQQQPLEAAREQVARTLKSARTAEARQKYLRALRAQSSVVILLEPPRLPIEIGAAPRRGSEAAPVTIVEFSDFQCPYCKRVQPVLRELLAKYGDQVSLVFKDLPLAMHPEAEKAAQAARCASDQGKFWEYHDALFGLAAVKPDSYGVIAAKLALNEQEFRNCLDSGKHRSGVEADLRQAQGLGIGGTPMFVINGIMLNGAQPQDVFARIIDRELEAQRSGSKGDGQE